MTVAVHGTVMRPVNMAAAGGAILSAMTCAVQFFARVAVVLLLTSATATWGQIGDDCTEVEINYEDDAALTKAEKLALMERAFEESLSRYSHCQNSSGGGAIGGNVLPFTAAALSEAQAAVCRKVEGLVAAGVAEAKAIKEVRAGDPDLPPAKTIRAWLKTFRAAATANGDGGADAAATPAASAASASVSGTETAVDQKESAQQAAAAQQPGGDSGGKPPEDIPPADNDDILAAQIRAAAEAESDPETKAALWNEYRKYKGLPTVDEESQ